MERFSSGRARHMRAAALLALSAAILGAPAGPLAESALASHAGAAKHRKKHRKKKPLKVTGGTLTLALSAQAWSHLEVSNGNLGGTTTTAVAPASGSATGTFIFPITGGSLGTAAPTGKVNASGGMTIASEFAVSGLFTSRSESTVQNPVVSLGSASTLTVTSGNFTPPTVPLMTLSVGKIRPASSTHGVTLRNVPALLTTAGQEFFGSSFKAGEQVGTVTIAAKR